MPDPSHLQWKNLGKEWSPGTQGIMVDGWLTARKGKSPPTFTHYVKKRLKRSKHKVIYFAAGPTLQIAGGTALGLATGTLMVTGGGVTLGAIGAALAGYAATKAWRNARQEYNRHRGMKKFRLKLDECGGLHSGERANISSNVVNRVRYFIQKGSLGKLTDDFKWIVEEEIKLEKEREVERRMEHCHGGLELATRLYTVDRRRKALMEASKDFRLFYMWVINEMDYARRLFSSENVQDLLERIHRMAQEPRQEAHQKCKVCCYRKNKNGRITKPAVDTGRYSKTHWKHNPFHRLMNDSMNMAYRGEKWGQILQYRDYQQKLRDLFDGIYNVDQNLHVFDLTDLSQAPTSKPDDWGNYAKGLGIGGAPSMPGVLVKGGLYTLRDSLPEIIKSSVPNSVPNLLSGSVCGVGGGVVGGVVKSLGELIHTSRHATRVNTPMDATGAKQILKQKSKRIASLRTLLKGGEFESGIDHFIQLRKRVTQLEKVIGPNATSGIHDCQNAVAVAFNMFNAIKHWQAMITPMFLLKEYAEILESEVILLDNFPDDEMFVMGRIDRMVKQHGENPCCKFCKCVPSDE